MEGSIVVTDPVPVHEQPEITSAEVMGPEPTQRMATDGSGGGHGSEASFPRLLTHEEQVRNLKENVKKILKLKWNLLVNLVNYEELETHPWFEKVVLQLQDDTCADSCKEIQMDSQIFEGLTEGATMTSLDVAILMGDLKMVQKILKKTSFDRKMLSHGPALIVTRMIIMFQLLTGLDPTVSHGPAIYYTPLHLAVLIEDSHIVHALLEKGANVNIPNWLSDTPLHYACRMEKEDMLLKLLEKDKDGKKPIHVAMQLGDIDHMVEKLPSLNVNVLDHHNRTPLHYLATNKVMNHGRIKDVVKYLAQNKELDIKALDQDELSAFYVAILYCNTKVVIALLDFFKDQIRLNEVCNEDFGPPIQIAFEGGKDYHDIESALMDCDPIKDYMERLYRDRQVYVDAANAILVGATLIASVTFASWLQPPLSYTSYSGEGYSSSNLAPSTSSLNYVDVEYNIPLRAFWIFNALSFYFAIATVVCGARSVLPRSHLFIAKNVEKLRINLWMISILLACSVLFVLVAFAIAGTIVLTPLLKYQWYMIVPTFVGGMVCIISLVSLVKSMKEIYSNTRKSTNVSKENRRDFLQDHGYRVFWNSL